jgi:hypothetical protein
MQAMKVRSWVARFLVMCLVITSVGVFGADRVSAAGKSYLVLVNQSTEFSSNAPINATVNVDSADLPALDDSVHLLVYANDVDEADGEWDKVSWNGTDLGAGPGEGILSGQNESDSTTVFTLSPSDVLENNGFQVRVTQGLGSTNDWLLNLHWIQLVIGGGPADKAEITRLQPTATAADTVTVAVDTKAILAGDYYLEVNLIDEQGYNRGISTQIYKEAVAGDVFKHSFDVSNLAPGRYTTNAILYEYNDNETVESNKIGTVQHLRKATIDTTVTLEGLSFVPSGGADPIALAPSPFSPYTTKYNASVPYGNDTLSPAPVLSLPSGQLALQVNGGGFIPVADPANPDDIPLQVGQNVIQYKVYTPEAPDGQIYTITIDRAPKLDDLILVPAAELDPEFDGDTPNPSPGYHTTVGNPQDSIVLTPVLPTDAHEDTTITVSLNGGAFEVLPDGGPDTDDLPLNVGRNTIIVRVTSPDGLVSTDYPIVVDREPALAAPGLSAGGDDLSPEFSSDVYDYVTVVGHTETPITLTPEVNGGETIEIRVNSDDEADFAPVGSGIESDELDLIAGTNIIEVRVKSPDYDTALAGVDPADKADLVKTYTFTVIRSPFLTDLIVHDEDLTEAFDAAELGYATVGSLPYTQSSVTVTPTTTDAPVKLEIRVNGGDYVEINSGDESAELPVISGDNTIEVRATSINPIDEEEYSTVYRVVVRKDYPPYVGPILPVSQLDAGVDEKGQRVLVTDIIGKELTLSASLLKSDGKALDRPSFTIGSNGSYTLANIPADSYDMVLTVNGPAGEKLAGHVAELAVGQDGRGQADGKLIDPRSKVTDIATGDALAGVEITLYWADTELNRSKGRTPGEAVKLPELRNFAPHQNNAVQTTSADGLFGWVPFVDSDYYFIATKEGYHTFDSRDNARSGQFGKDSQIAGGIIHIGQSIVTYDFSMKPEGAETSSGTHEPYMNGYPDGKFKPERGISRAELAAVLSRIIPVNPAVSVNVPQLSDLKTRFWASESIETSLKQGWLKGYTDGTFQAARFVTRAELAQVIYNMKAAEWKDVSLDSKFSDIAGHWGAKAIAAATNQGLFTGDANGKFRPNDAVTRAEAVTLFNNLLDRNPEEVSGTPRWSDVPTSYWAYEDVMEASITHEYVKYDNGVEVWAAE